MLVSVTSETCPAGICPGQRKIPGTRWPPSMVPNLPPLKGPAEPGQIIFRQLYKWLRKNGVNVDNPLYIFRKEAGSIIFEQTDSFDLAADFLRNDPRIAREYYVSRKRKLSIEVPGLN